MPSISRSGKSRGSSIRRFPSVPVGPYAGRIQISFQRFQLPRRCAASRHSPAVDDNRLNFKKGETFSKIFKGVHDLELKYGDSGVFVRGKYWYDFELKDEHRPFYDIDDSGRDDLAKSSGAEFLDAFVYHNYNIGDLPGNVRLGKQVVSWGESTFIGNRSTASTRSTSPPCVVRVPRSRKA